MISQFGVVTGAANMNGKNAAAVIITAELPPFTKPGQKLDIVVSTHNVLIMIAPWVGTPTKFASWRQSPYNNVLLAPRGPSLDTFERNTWEPWKYVFKLIVEDIYKN